jgi:hypothetical protein
MPDPRVVSGCLRSPLSSAILREQFRAVVRRSFPEARRRRHGYFAGSTAAFFGVAVRFVATGVFLAGAAW